MTFLEPSVAVDKSHIMKAGRKNEADIDIAGKQATSEAYASPGSSALARPFAVLAFIA